MEHGGVLVVEDDSHVRDAVARALRFEGYDVHTAVDGNDALLRVDEIEPDVIVLDVLMPGTDGLAVCRILRERGNRTPVLMLTARHEVSDRVAGLDAIIWSSRLHSTNCSRGCVRSCAAPASPAAKRFCASTRSRSIPNAGRRGAATASSH
jgi:CheY-like chemotaxis protein